MLGSFQIAKFNGIPIRLNVTLLIVAAMLVANLGWIGIPAGILLFGSVLLHELGHALVAQRYGITIAGIDLHLLGGVALMAEPPKNAKQELWIAAAGPAVSLVLGLSFLLLTWVTGAGLAMGSLGWADLPAYLAAVNIGMAIFNMVPALPMDGGRIFRALMAGRWGSLRATQIAARVSRAFGTAFVLGGLFYGNWSIALIGGMLFLMVSREERVAEAMEARRNALAQIQARPEIFVDQLGRRYIVINGR